MSTSYLNLDNDGTILAPVKNLKIVIGAPDVSSAPNSPTNPIELNLYLTVKHPCRSVVFTNQVVPDMTSNVNFGPDTYNVN